MPRFLASFIPALIVLTAAGYSQASGDPCLGCHEQKTPGIVQYWKKSAHFQKNIGCADCHGVDIEANHRRTATVDASKCGTCHKAEFMDHRGSKHGIGLKTGGGCTRTGQKTGAQQAGCALCHAPDSAKPFVETACSMFLAQSPEMQRQGCTACHLVETRCDTCHTKHGTDRASAQDPNVCGVCHMGPDHAQREMWETSRHGILYRQEGKGSAPSCVTCHMRAGSHNVSKGISSGMPHETTSGVAQEREYMLFICSECHTKTYSARNLDDADRIREQSAALVEEAGDIIKELQKDGLLSPSPQERPSHPLFGKNFTIGPHMLYEDLSSVESLFFKMKAFYALTAYKGAFHQNPDYAHWYGNAPLKLTLSEIKSEAALLRKVDTLRKRIDSLSTPDSADQGEYEGLRKNLRKLNERRLKGELTEQDYQAAKNKLLKELGL